MLISIMENICENADRYGKHQWLFRITGPVLEICVQPGYQKDPEQFRQALISIGQVLQAVESMALRHNEKIRIKILPSLLERHLVAIVRLQNNNEEASKDDINFINPDQPVLKLLKTIASLYGMNLEEMPQKDQVSVVLNEILAEFSTESHDKQNLVLCSKTDNPFIWLKTGYWKERVLQLQVEHLSISGIEIYKLHCMDFRSRLNKHLSDCPFPQLLIRV